MSKNKERIAELKKQRKAMDKELDELKGKTAKEKAMSVLLFFPPSDRVPCRDAVEEDDIS